MQFVKNCLQMRGVGQAATYVGFAGISSGANAILIPVMLTYLDPFEYGNLAIFQSLYSIATQITFFSLRPPIIRELTVQSHKDPAGYVGSAMGLVGTLTAIIAVLGLIFGRMLDRLFGLPYWLVLLLLLCAGAQSAYQIYLTVLQVDGRAWRYVLVQTGLLVMNIAITLSLLIGVDFGWMSRAFGYMIVAIMGAMVAFKALSSRRLLGRVKIHYAVEMVGLSGAVAFSTILVANFDRLIIGGMFSPRDAGLYTLASQITSVLMLFSSAVMLVVSPWAFRTMAKCTSASDWRRFYEKLVGVVVVISVVAVPFGIAVEVLCQHFSNWRYVQMLEFFPWLLAACYFAALQSLFVPVLYFFKNVTAVNLSAILLVGFNLLSLAILPRLLGPQGVALSLFVARGAQLAFVIVAGGLLVGGRSWGSLWKGTSR